MNYVDFSYENETLAGAQVRVAVFHDVAFERAQIEDDLRGAGYCLGRGGDLDTLLSNPDAAGGDVIMLNCDTVDAARTADFARLDIHLGHKSTQLVISTRLDDLDAVFASFDQCSPQILIEPSRAEQMLAIVRTMQTGKKGTLREMSDDERIRMMQLATQIDEIAQRLDGDGERGRGKGLILREAGLGNFHAKQARPAEASLIRRRSRLPDPTYVRDVIRQRQSRSRFFDAALFGDPAWDMLLDLTAARGEKQPVSVTSLCIASGVPATTALRWIKQMVEMGLFERKEDAIDKRRAFIELSDKSADAMAQYFADAGEDAFAA